jgi:23S rRNA pseudouridine2605 synthase
MRLQRMMALAGVASRRTCEIYIQQGRVRVNDRVVTELGTRVQPGVDLVEFDGRTLNINTPRHYYLLYKPVGYLSSVSDPHGARVVTELVPSDERLYPVGRLDLNSEGLLLVTDDGDLTFRLTHPRYEHEKEYLVQVPAALSDEQLAQLQRGVRIHEVGYPARAAGAEQLPETWRWRGEAVPEGHRWLRIVLKEGRKRQIRLMLEALGSEAVRLIRIRMGP